MGALVPLIPNAPYGRANGIGETQTVTEWIEGLLGAGVTHFEVEVGTAAHTRVAGIGYKVAFVDRKHPLGDGGIESIALNASLYFAHRTRYSPIVAVEVQINCSNIACMVDVEHFATIISRDAQPRHIAVGRSVDWCSNPLVAPNTEVESSMIMIGTYFGKGARRSKWEVRGRSQLRRLVGLRRSSERQNCK